MRNAAPPAVSSAIRTGGAPLTPAAQSHWESRLGQDLSQVRVHADGTAARAANAVDASAFTVGRHVVFGGSHGVASEGGRLLGHELVHAVQQGLADPPSQELSVRPAAGPAEAAARTLASDGASGPPLGGVWRPPPVAPIRAGSVSPSVQRQEKKPGQGTGTAATKRTQKPVKVEGKVSAAELRSHATGARGGSGSTAARRQAGSGQGSAPAPAPQQAPAPAPQQAPTPPPQQAPVPRTPPVTGTPVTSKPSGQTATGGGQQAVTPPAPAPAPTPAPAPAAGSESGLFAGGRGLGVDLQLQPQELFGARDRFDPAHPGTPLSAPRWRGGPDVRAGDVQVPINVILLDRELRIAGGEQFNFGFEPQVIITPLGLSPHEGGWHYQPAIAVGLDLLHLKIGEDLDWHILQAQGILQGDIPFHGSAGYSGGGQIGMGIESALPHSGPDERFTVGANLAGQAMWGSDGSLTYAIVGSVFLTWHIRHH
jgi:Domain of unknown function (DUF4157)